MFYQLILKQILMKRKRVAKIELNNYFSVIGTGPGGKDYILPVAYKQAQQSDLLIGSRRLLDLFSEFNKKEIELKSNYENILKVINKNFRKEKISVLVSGDPGYHSFLDFLNRNIDSRSIVVIPGISSFQYLFSKAGLSWHDSELISFHGHDLKISEQQIKSGRKLIMLTDKINSPSKISTLLLNYGVKDRKVLIGENLTLENEKIYETTLYNLTEELKEEENYKLCVMVLI